MNFPFKNMPDVLPGTKPLTWNGDLSVKMLDGAHKFIEEKIKESVDNRLKLWNRNFSSREAYEISVEPNRKRFIKYIGVEDKNEPLKTIMSACQIKIHLCSCKNFLLMMILNLLLKLQNTGCTRSGGRY